MLYAHVSCVRSIISERSDKRFLDESSYHERPLYDGLPFGEVSHRPETTLRYLFHNVAKGLMRMCNF